MVLYESHSVIHGRPFPLKGRYFANLFIHFEPVGHSLRHDAKLEQDEINQDVHEKYRKAVEMGHGGHENAQSMEALPPYILPGSEEANLWAEEHPEGYEGPVRSIFGIVIDLFLFCLSILHSAVTSLNSCIRFFIPYDVN